MPYSVGVRKLIKPAGSCVRLWGPKQTSRYAMRTAGLRNVHTAGSRKTQRGYEQYTPRISGRGWRWWSSCTWPRTCLARPIVCCSAPLTCRWSSRRPHGPHAEPGLRHLARAQPEDGRRPPERRGAALHAARADDDQYLPAHPGRIALRAGDRGAAVGHGKSTATVVLVATSSKGVCTASRASVTSRLCRMISLKLLFLRRSH